MLVELHSAVAGKTDAGAAASSGAAGRMALLRFRSRSKG